MNSSRSHIEVSRFAPFLTIGIYAVGPLLSAPDLCEPSRRLEFRPLLEELVIVIHEAGNRRVVGKGGPE
jgi:hypothetical protein